jgi:hypothetical protein
MITKFDTSSATPTSKSGGGMSMVTIVLIAVAAYAGYRFVLKPYLDKNKEEKNG